MLYKGIGDYALKKIIFATKNQGKMKEIRAIMKELNVEVLSMEEAGIDIDVVEDGSTFTENAIKKAKEIMEITGEITMSDDSGLEIDAMNKEPGIYSARFMGEDTPYEVRFEKIFENLNGLPQEKRTARFVSCIATCFPEGKTLTSLGTIEGYIGTKVVNGNGFGYDPIFVVPEENKHISELSPEEKNRISHRGKALAEMKLLLKKEGF